MTAPAAMADELDDSHLPCRDADSYGIASLFVDAIPGRRRRRPHDHGQQAIALAQADIVNAFIKAQGGGEIAISPRCGGWHDSLGSPRQPGSIQMNSETGRPRIGRHRRGGCPDHGVHVRAPGQTVKPLKRLNRRRRSLSRRRQRAGDKGFRNRTTFGFAEKPPLAERSDRPR